MGIPQPGPTHWAPHTGVGGQRKEDSEFHHLLTVPINSITENKLLWAIYFPLPSISVNGVGVNPQIVHAQKASFWSEGEWETIKMVPNALPKSPPTWLCWVCLWWWPSLARNLSERTESSGWGGWFAGLCSSILFHFRKEHSLLLGPISTPSSRYPLTCWACFSSLMASLTHQMRKSK